MKLTNCDLAIASEGSFGPSIGLFVHADDEFYYLWTKKTIIVRDEYGNKLFRHKDY
jgi:hypothetical protein